MNNTNLIDAVLRPRTLSLRLVGPWGSTTELHVVLPDLRSSPRSMWGDWGPMYTVSLPPEHPVELHISSSTHPTPLRQVLDLSRIAVESPPLAATRVDTPLVMILPIVQEDIRLMLFFDHDGQLVRGELAPLAKGTTASKMLRVEIEPETAVVPDASEINKPARTSRTEEATGA